MPLHQYSSPNGQGLCTYAFEEAVCGHPMTGYVHLSKGSLITSHPFRSAPGVPGVAGCVWEYGDRKCGSTPQMHFSNNLPFQIQVEFPVAPDPVGDYLAEKADHAYETYHGASFPVDYPDPTTAQVVAMFHDRALRLAVDKDQAYRKAWVEQGYIGNVARILSKASRLRNMVWCDQASDLPPEVAAPTEQEEETLRDTLLDMANLCAFAAHNMAQGNRWGGQRG